MWYTEDDLPLVVLPHGWSPHTRFVYIYGTPPINDLKLNIGHVFCIWAYLPFIYRKNHIIVYNLEITFYDWFDTLICFKDPHFSPATLGRPMAQPARQPNSEPLAAGGGQPWSLGQSPKCSGWLDARGDVSLVEVIRDEPTTKLCGGQMLVYG